MLRACRSSTISSIIKHNFYKPPLAISSIILLQPNNVGNFNPSRQFSYQETVTTIWKSISNSTPVAYLQDGLVILHDSTGLPWWATIILSTVALRSIVTLPFTIYQVFMYNILQLI